LPSSSVGRSKKRAVRAFLIAMSMLAQPRPVHAGEGLEVGAGVDDGDVHLRADGLGLGLRGRHDRLSLGQAEVEGHERPAPRGRGGALGGGSPRRSDC